MEKLMDRAEAARYLGISVRSLDRRVRAEEIPCVRLGTGPKAPVRFTVDQIDSYLAHCRDRRPSVSATIARLLK